MALETASFINQLNAANPQSTDSVSQADDHIRLIKSAIKATFPNITGAVTRTQAELNQPVPVGFIGMWSGSIVSIPTGWALCDGTNGTPDLRDRFIVGAGSTYSVGNTGGSASVALTVAQLPSHTHSITASTGSAGAHTHTITDPGHTHGYVNNTSGASGTGGTAATSLQNSTTDSSTTGISINSDGAHTHTVTATAANTGSGQAHENRPPYFALAYIMKT
jgi:microcystin-dependent protein